MGEKTTSVAQEEKSEFYVIGVGASAGGLDALSKFLKSFNEAKSNMCVVIVMHLSKDHKSELAPILDKRCKWNVVVAENNVQLENEHVYVCPKNKQISIKDNTLVFEALSSDLPFTPSIDNFFMSLAKAKSKKAIGVILSGFGEDGCKGINTINENGGFTIAQLPETAEHREMPQAAIDTGKIDLVLPAAQMYDDIVQYTDNIYTIASSGKMMDTIDIIFELLEKRSGTDFSIYKPTTIMRRINHRIASLQLDNISEYYEVIKKNPQELDKLFESVLIGVTEFFRNLEAFEKLKKQLRKLIEGKEKGDSIRVWSVGCATGEEAYSVAIMLYELLGDEVGNYNLQVFASDIDERAINFGRKGVYHKKLLDNVPAEIIGKCFDKSNDVHLVVKKEIRKHVLFARHDITTDPPFVNLDLVICRNLLIYFNKDLQKQSLQVFHYALKTNGLLFLGKSESVTIATDLFSKKGKGKIFQKAEASLSYQLKFSRLKSKNHKLKKEGNNNGNGNRNMSLVDVAKETLYHKYDEPFIIINENSEIKEVHGSLRLYLEISEGTMNINLHKMLNLELVSPIKALLAQVKKTNVSHTSHTIKFKLYGQIHYVRVKIVPLMYRVGDVQYYMIIFETVEQSSQQLELQKKLETSDFENLRIKELEDELNSTKEHLKIFTEELEAANEELQSVNEELQSSNEELKTSNEELETGNEELQSSNEELTNVNQDLQQSNKSLEEKKEELKKEKDKSNRSKLIYQTIIDNFPDGAIGVLNENFEIEHIGGKYLEKADLRKTDLIGLPLPETELSYKGIENVKAILTEALEGKTSSTQLDVEQSSYSVQVIPFKLPNSDKNKILYIAQDITEIKKDTLKYKVALEAANVIICEYNFASKKLVPNPKFSQFLGVESKQDLSLEDLSDFVCKNEKEKIIKALKKALQTGKIDKEVCLTIKKEKKWIQLFGTIIFTNDGLPQSVIVSIIDITQNKMILQNRTESEERFKAISNITPVTIWITDKEGNCTYINKHWLELTGSTIKQNLGKGWLQFIHDDDKTIAENTYLSAHEKRIAFQLEYRARRHDGEYFWFLNRAVPTVDNDGRFNGYIGSFANINEHMKFRDKLEKEVEERTKDIRNANTELVKLNINLEEFAYIASHDLKEPLRKIQTFSSIITSRDNKTDVNKYLPKIKQSAERMSDLIEHILEYSRIKKDGIKSEKVDLDSVYEEVISDLSLLIQEQNVQLNCENLGSITGMSVRIYQLFSNLIRNAIKFNENVPEIEITVMELEGKKMKKHLKANENVRFKSIMITDNGIGFDEAKKDYIFKPFKRLNSTSDYAGTGIGLAICKRIMDLHNGCLDVESEIGKGSSFTMYFPMYDESSS